MPDQTPVTDDDRKAHKWASHYGGGPLDPVARAIRAHVPAPPKSLADELRSAAGEVAGLDIGVQFFTQDKDKAYRRLNALADRVEAVEKELAGTKRDYIECQEELIEADRQRDEARAEVERLTATFKEPLKEPGHLPDPADVEPWTAWLIEFEGRRYEARRSPGAYRDYYWSFMRDGAPCSAKDAEVTLVSRLVPDTRRVIDRPEELNKLPADSVVLDGIGRVCVVQRPGTIYRFGRIVDMTITSERCISWGPVTVIYEPTFDQDGGRTPDCPARG